MVDSPPSKRQKRRNHAAKRIPWFANELTAKVLNRSLTADDVFLLYLEHCQLKGCPKKMPRKKEFLESLCITGHDDLSEVQLLLALSSTKLTKDEVVEYSAELFSRALSDDFKTPAWPTTGEYALA